MTTRPCPVDRCNSTVADDRNVCGACGADLERHLAELPALIDDLETTLARHRNQIGEKGGKNDEPALPYDPRAGDALRAIRIVLTGWTRDLEPHPDRQPRDHLQTLARWLLARLNRLLAHPAASDICTEIENAVREGRRSRARDTRAQFALPDPCPDCGAQLHATMHELNDPRPNTVWCLGDQPHTWEPHQWLRLGHRLGYGRESA